MLRSLSGRWHFVYTGFAVKYAGQSIADFEETSVCFREMSEREIEAYVATGECMDKAGAYGIQDQAAIFVEALDGDYYNVMGLPLCSLTKCLRRWGISVLGN